MAENLSQLLWNFQNLFGKNTKNDDKVDRIKRQIFEECSGFLQLSSTILKHDVCNFLYMLGCNLRRNSYFLEASKVFETAVNIQDLVKKSDDSILDTSNITIMKVHFELASCYRELDNAEISAEHFEKCLHMCYHHCSDWQFEKKVTLDYCGVLMRRSLFEEAISGYLKILSVSNELMQNGNEENRYLKEEIEIHFQLSFAYSELQLYKDSIKHGLLVLEKMDNKQNDLTKQISNLLGSVYRIIGNLQLSLFYYKQYFNMETDKSVEKLQTCEIIISLQIETNQMEEAQVFIQKLQNFGRNAQNDLITFKVAISRGNILLAQDLASSARNQYELASKLARTFSDDFDLECQAQSKIAESFSKEGRHTQAIYSFEKALALARKTKVEELIDEMKLNVAMSSQHSTSEKELNSALSFLLGSISLIYKRITKLYEQEVEIPPSEDVSLIKQCKAVQVILYRLHQHESAIYVAEWMSRYNFAKVSERIDFLPQALPDNIPLNEEMSLNLNSEEIGIYFTICEEDILIQLSHQGNVVSHLVSEYVINGKKTIERIKNIVDIIHKGPDTYDKLSIVYNREKRLLPSTSTKVSAEMTNYEKGDYSANKKKEVITNEPNESGDNASLDAILKELFNVLLKPLNFDWSESTLCVYIVAEGFLQMIPFDLLPNPADESYFGANISILQTPCIHAIIRKSEQTYSAKFRSSRSTTRFVTSVRYLVVYSDARYFRDEILKECFSGESDLEALDKVGIKKELSGLITSTASGATTLKSPRYITPHKQSNFPLRSCVFGCPELVGSFMYDGNVWNNRQPLNTARHECDKVAKYLNVEPITGKLATKKSFLEEFSRSTVMHVATFADLSKGNLAFAPNNFPTVVPPFPASSYLVTSHDLQGLQSSSLKLLVLVSGHSNNEFDPKLPNSLISAGARCVVYMRWSVPDCVLEKFLFHFYKNLQNSCKVSKSLFEAKMATKERYPEYFLWNAFVELGCDVTIDLGEIRRVQWQDKLNHLEFPFLATTSLVDAVPSDAERLERLQICLSRLSGCVSCDSDVISFMLGLVEEGTERLMHDENADRPLLVIPRTVKGVGGTTELLALMGFDLQSIDPLTLPPTSTMTSQRADEMIIFPHWNQDGLLLPCHQALIGLHELCQSVECLHAVALMLPLDQTTLCNLIDLLSIFYHTPEVQVRTSDVTTSKLWRQPTIRRFLRHIGIVNVRELLVFCKTLLNRTLLLASLQLMTSFSIYRDQKVLEQLNVEQLGEIPRPGVKGSHVKLDSLQVTSLPRNEVAVTSSWMRGSSFKCEGANRKHLVVEIRKLSDKYSQALAHAKWWHRDVTIPQQADNSVVSSPRDQTAPRKVKVVGGGTPSCGRVAVAGEVARGRPSLAETLLRRGEARQVLRNRCDELDRRHRADVREAYMGYDVTGRM